FSFLSGLLVAFSNLKSRVFNKIQPLFAKRRGWGVPGRISSTESITSRLSCSHIAILLAAILLFAPAAFAKSQAAPPANAVPANFFGMHFHHAGTTTPWPAMPIG